MSKEVLQIGVRESEGTRVLRLAGDLDTYTTAQLSRVCRTWLPGAKRIVVDLDRLEYIDSAGLSALVGIWVQANQDGAEMAVVCRNPRVRRVFEITGLLNLFPIEDAVSPTTTFKVTGYVSTEDPDTGVADHVSRPVISSTSPVTRLGKWPQGKMPS